MSAPSSKSVTPSPALPCRGGSLVPTELKPKPSVSSTGLVEKDSWGKLEKGDGKSR